MCGFISVRQKCGVTSVKKRVNDKRRKKNLKKKKEGLKTRNSSLKLYIRRKY